MPLVKANGSKLHAIIPCGYQPPQTCFSSSVTHSLVMRLCQAKALKTQPALQGLWPLLGSGHYCDCHNSSPGYIERARSWALVHLTCLFGRVGREDGLLGLPWKIGCTGMLESSLQKGCAGAGQEGARGDQVTGREGRELAWGSPPPSLTPGPTYPQREVPRTNRKHNTITRTSRVLMEVKS